LDDGGTLSVVPQGQEPISRWMGESRPSVLDGSSPSLIDQPLMRDGPLRRWLRGGHGSGLFAPLPHESWIRRPLCVTWFMGAMSGSPIIHDWLRADSGMFGGLRVGWDFSHYFGAEFRVGWSTFEVADSARAVEARRQLDDALGYAPNSPFRNRFEGRTGQFFLYDLSALYYPLGDRPFRPYFLIGIGGTRLSASDRMENTYDPMLLTMPVGVGVKYQCVNWLAVRVEVLDNLAFGAEGVQTMHNISVVAAAEIRLGGAHRSYWPWNPGRAGW
jgi:hypothetical protein